MERLTDLSPSEKEQYAVLKYLCGISISKLNSALTYSTERLVKWGRELAEEELNWEGDYKEQLHDILDSITIASLIITIGYITECVNPEGCKLNVTNVIYKSEDYIKELLETWRLASTLPFNKRGGGLSELERIDAKNMISYLKTHVITDDLDQFVALFTNISLPSIQRVILKYDL